jgi:peptide/nickel transport system substrate-binding protein
MKKYGHYSLVILFFGLLLTSCSSYKRDPSEVVVWDLADPQMINPILAGDAEAQDIDNNVFQPLMNFDYRTLKLVPILADSLPAVRVDSAGRMLITLEIRKEAKWDNGTPVTAKDVEFTFKVIKNTTVNDEPLRTYYDMVGDFILYPDNPRKFTVVCDYKYMYGPISVGTNTYIIPEYAYDPNKNMQGFTIKQMHDDKNCMNDSKMVAFGKEFNTEKYSRDPKYISGSGAYKFTQWITGQRVILEKKKDWWGNALEGVNCFFDANASKLIYQTINDMTSALVALKAGNIDVMYAIKPQDFNDLPKSEKFTENFNTYAPLMYYYGFIGINMANPKFADVKTRQAIAHLVDVPRIIKDVWYGYARQITGPISPMDSLDYDYNLKPYEFNIDTAKALLAEAGWKDSDGDGVLDKVIDGQKTDFTIDFLVNAGNDVRKKSALMFKEEARKVGITVNVIQQDFNIYMNNLKTHKFDMFMSSWIFQPGPQDFKQIFYTTSALNKGSNWISFGDAKSDALIDSIRAELDEKKRAGMYKRLEWILHEQCGYVFIGAAEALMAINKRFSNAYPSSNNPFYWEAGFKAGSAK